ncbi:uncharacterized protein LOC126298778 isoform X2 [Schistocerca gregaria]|uniref:uncharacterized protein LOC126298778 isoform X2 n=1 Tax=Schistocerca gregaria TaxID=7010 RepID=UPI00211E96EE|nr:uncharacterized protein LOC126298778 isoform X2 [Schistocerca gregaria]
MLTGLNLHYTHHELRYCLKQQTEVQIVSQHACSLVNAALLYIVYCRRVVDDKQLLKWLDEEFANEDCSDAESIFKTDHNSESEQFLDINDIIDKFDSHVGKGGMQCSHRPLTQNTSNENEAVGPSTGSGIHIAEQSDTDFSEQTDLVVEELSQTTTSSTNREYYIKIWYTKEKKVK